MEKPEKKTFEFKMEIQDKNTPSDWKFNNMNQIEQVFTWTVIKKIAEDNIKKMIG